MNILGSCYCSCCLFPRVRAEAELLLFLGDGFVACAEKSRAGAGDRPGVGTVGLGCSCGVPRRGTPKWFAYESLLIRHTKC